MNLNSYRFPGRHFGKLYGLVMSLSAVVSLLQYPCFALNKVLGGDPFYVNLSFPHHNVNLKRAYIHTVAPKVFGHFGTQKTMNQNNDIRLNKYIAQAKHFTKRGFKW